MLTDYAIAVFNKGLVRHLPEEIIPDEAIVSGKNAQLNYAGLENAPGYTKFTPTALAEGIIHLATFEKLDGTNQLIALTKSHLYYYDHKTDSWVQVADQFNTAAQNQFYSTANVVEQQGEFLLITNGTDPIKKWDGSTLANVQFNPAVSGDKVPTVKAYQLVVHGANRLVVADTSETVDGTTRRYRQRIRWSDAGRIDYWESTAFMDLAQTDDAIMAIGILREQIVVYKARSIWMLQEVGYPETYLAQPVTMFRGLVGRRAWCEVRGMHIFVGEDNVYRFTGAELEPIGEPIKDLLYMSNHPAFWRSIICYSSFDQRRVYIAYSDDGTSIYPNKVLAYNVMLNAWETPRERPVYAVTLFRQQRPYRMDELTNAADTYDVAWEDLKKGAAPVNLFGDTNGYIYQDDTGNDLDGAAMTSEITTKWFNLGSPLVKRIANIILGTRELGSYTFNLTVETTNDLVEAPVQIASVTVDQTSKEIRIPVDGVGRWVRFRISSTNPWVLYWMRIQFQPWTDYFMP